MSLFEKEEIQLRTSIIARHSAVRKVVEEGKFFVNEMYNLGI
jgi:hypothetical protein